MKFITAIVLFISGASIGMGIMPTEGLGAMLFNVLLSGLGGWWFAYSLLD